MRSMSPYLHGESVPKRLSAGSAPVGESGLAGPNTHRGRDKHQQLLRAEASTSDAALKHTHAAVAVRGLAGPNKHRGREAAEQVRADQSTSDASLKQTHAAAAARGLAGPNKNRGREAAAQVLRADQSTSDAALKHTHAAAAARGLAGPNKNRTREAAAQVLRANQSTSDAALKHTHAAAAARGLAGPNKNRTREASQRVHQHGLESMSSDFQAAVHELGAESCVPGFGSGLTSSHLSAVHSCSDVDMLQAHGSAADTVCFTEELSTMVAALQLAGEVTAEEQVLDLGADDLDGVFPDHEHMLADAEVLARNAITSNSLAIAQWMLEKGASESMMTSFIKDLMPQLCSGHPIVLDDLPTNAKAALQVLEKATSTSAVKGRPMQAWVCHTCGWECHEAKPYAGGKELPKTIKFKCGHKPCTSTDFERLTWTMHELSDIFRVFIENPRTCDHALDHTRDGMKSTALLRSERYLAARRWLDRNLTPDPRNCTASNHFDGFCPFPGLEQWSCGYLLTQWHCDAAFNCKQESVSVWAFFDGPVHVKSLQPLWAEMNRQVRPCNCLQCNSSVCATGG
jgi:hypothetical protein